MRSFSIVSMSDSNKHIPKWLWILAFFYLPVGPFICLYYLGVIGIKKLIAYLSFGILSSIGMVSVLGETNGYVCQTWLEVLMYALVYIAAFIQFTEGRSIWSEAAVRDWKKAGWFGGIWLFIVVGMLVLNLHFHV